MRANSSTLFLLLLCALPFSSFWCAEACQADGSGRAKTVSTPGGTAISARAADTKTEGPDIASKVIDQIEGVYKRRFKNALVSGEEYQDEDILEIVRVTQDAVYFRTHLGFYNGDVCNLYGVATYQDGAFIFRDNPKNSKCVFFIKPGKDRLELHDPDLACRAFYCGVRGDFVGRDFPLEVRRPIRYLHRLKNSREYSESIKAFEADQSQEYRSPHPKQ